jgi:hypothetical protein
MKIAILGWGSLLWDLQPKFESFEKSCEPVWHLDGPVLNIEFLRISSSRNGALTLVIDDKAGSPMTVAWRFSKRKTLEDAICDLRCREGAGLKDIGYCSKDKSSTSSTSLNKIEEWRKTKKFDAVVWTALPSNFKDKTKKKFSVKNAIAHIQGLKDEGKAMAFEYICRAPEFVKTPLRTALQKEPWFKNISS